MREGARELRRPRKLTGVVVASICALIVTGAATTAQAIPYFNADFGFDNSTLMLEPELEIPTDIDPAELFIPVLSGNNSNDIGLLSEDEILDDPTVDRVITWTIRNNDPANIGEFFLFFTALANTTPPYYFGANFDLDIDGYDPMTIGTYGPYFLAGFHLTPDDFSLVNGHLEATRTFRYSVDVNEGAGGTPDLGIAATVHLTPVPEPATGLLLAGATLVALRVGRKQRG